MSNKKVSFDEFWEWVRGVILGIALGISGTKAYQATFGEPKTPNTAVVTLLRTSSNLSCLEGRHEVMKIVIGQTTAKEAITCNDVAQKWVDIFEGKR